MNSINEMDQSLGEFLRQKREQKNISLEQVASATKISIRSLHALESDLFLELPAIPFIRGFVISYCRFIGLDPKNTLKEYEFYIQKKSEERPNRDLGLSRYAFEKKEIEVQNKILLFISVFSFVFIGGIMIFFSKNSFRKNRLSPLEKLRIAHHQEKEKEKEKEKQEPQQAPPLSAISLIKEPPPKEVPEKKQVSIPKQEAETPKMPGLNPNDPLDSGLELTPAEIQYKFIFQVRGDIWVHYQVDQRPIRKFIVREGNKLVLRAKDSIKIQFSNPDVIKMNYNGKIFDSLTESPLLFYVQERASIVVPKESDQNFSTLFENESLIPESVNP